MDNLSQEQRKFAMHQVKSFNTAPEKMVRSLLHRMGFRFRTHRADLPGKPDIVLPKYRTVIFIHGCFWHRHENCKRASILQTNQIYWEQKFKKNVERDQRIRKQLEDESWRVEVIWECELHDVEALIQRLKRLSDSATISSTAVFQYSKVAESISTYKVQSKVD
jgi:DNA mismatch endonuclease, patch repair protein